MTDEPKPPSALGLAVPLTEEVIASFERLARGEPTEDLVKSLAAEVRRLRQRVTAAEPRVPDESVTEATPTVADASRPLTEKELADFERVAGAFRHALHVADEIRDPGKAVIESSFAVISIRLVGEIRRLRQLVIDAERYVPDNEQTRTMDLPRRLKDELDRK